MPTSLKPNPLQLLTQAAAAVHIGISLRSFQRALSSDNPPIAVRVHGDRRDRLLFQVEDLDEWIESRRERRAASRPSSSDSTDDMQP
jgi:hypothetical protein